MQVKVAGKTFEVDAPYAEGHYLTAAEAAVLNQARAMNIRANFKSTVKAGGTDGELQAKLDRYAKDYTFGTRRRQSSGEAPDPVLTLALKIAKERIRAKLRERGQTANAEALTVAAKAFLASPKGEAIMNLARQRIAEDAAMAAEIDMPLAQAAE